ncbi:oxidoreductase-like protein [Angomonas deanei]|uniref:Oxidoreductase family, NAD-binding Rossmann fold, putative n=1 Tax=Angomonas deanei TaxID=59799 RepID=A0A7G2CLN1_9TRYP|nr:oxidoreductase-like protein [Angomonas deanei]CAD2219172.1 Oxidoreductase family, NAD-binding Rossmann fold, putative [Angomonas deanei]|eukprot:EPY34558.1 oxidoreductase-like protein [Angomonas deanei]
MKSSKRPSDKRKLVSSEIKLRVGVLGCARILYKTWPAIHRAGHEIVYIGCRDTSRAEKFIRRMREELQFTNTPKVGSYDDVIENNEVDVVYVPLPVGLRDAYVQKCIKHGKHVVGEKPASLSSAELLDWLQKMAPRRLLFMDGTMLSHSSRTQAVVEKVKAMGGAQHIDVNCSFMANDQFLRSDIRVQVDLEPYGALGDLGWYAIRWVLHLVDFTLPEAVSARVVACTSKGAITAFEGNLKFRLPDTDKLITATIYCSFVNGYQQDVRVLTKKGVVTLEGAINPTYEDKPRYAVSENTFIENNFTTQTGGAPGLIDRSVDTVYAPNHDEADPTFQSEQLWRDVGNSLLRLRRNEPITINPDEGSKWGMYAFRTQLVMDALLNAARENEYNIFEAKRQLEEEAARAAEAAEKAAAEQAAKAAAKKEAQAAAKAKKAEEAEKRRASGEDVPQPQPPGGKKGGKKGKKAPANAIAKTKISLGDANKESDFPFSLF